MSQPESALNAGSTSEIDAIATLYAEARFAEISPVFEQLIAGGRLIEDILFAAYQRIRDRGDAQGAVNFLISCAASLKLDAARCFALADRFSASDEQLAATNLYVRHLQLGGAAPSAFEACILSFISAGKNDLVIQTYEEACRRGARDQLQNATLFNVAAAYSSFEQYETSARLYREILRDDPDMQLSKANLFALAKHHSIPEAIDYCLSESLSLAQSLPNFESHGRTTAPWVARHGEQTAQEIAEAVNLNGFCHVRDACDPAVLGEMLAHVTSGWVVDFPSRFDDVIRANLGRMLKIDAAAIASKVLQKPAAIDDSHCYIRQVDPDDDETPVPFHQDTTAFRALLVNVWIPLTPAGGDYPSLQLVRKRINKAEQTVIKTGRYNIIEIEEAEVLAQYGDLLHEVGDASIGDCVIFIGTTIHRSHNIRRAKKIRYNFEVRWS